MTKRLAMALAVAAIGVIALGAQTATSTPGEPVDSDPPDLQLSGDKKQDPQADTVCDRDFCDVIVNVSCGDEGCTARAKGRLTEVTKDKLTPDGPRTVPSGETRKVGPELTKKSQRREVRAALNLGKNVRAKVTVRATDAAGNVATATRTVRLFK